MLSPYVLTSQTSSMTVLSSSFAISSSYAQSSSQAITSSHFIGVDINQITITTTSSVDTNTTGSNGYGQHGRNTKISNSTNPISITCVTSSNADFVASYTKIGTGIITFVAGTGATIVQLPTSGGVALTGIVGSNARLTRNGNTFYLELNNY